MVRVVIYLGTAVSATSLVAFGVPTHAATWDALDVVVNSVVRAEDGLVRRP